MGTLNLLLPAIIPIRDDVHAIIAAQSGRRLSGQLGFDLVEQAALCTAILELGRNIVKYAVSGEILLDIVQDGVRTGVRVIARDAGPGIPDIELAMQDGYSTGRSLGLGLPGAKRLMSTFELVSAPGQGTTVTMIKWKAS